MPRKSLTQFLVEQQREQSALPAQLRGGVFMYPWDSRNPDAAGKLRLLYEANPMGFLIEQAGGMAFEEDHPILEIAPQALHQRVGVTMGDRYEVERILGYFTASVPQ